MVGVVVLYLIVFTWQLQAKESSNHTVSLTCRKINAVNCLI